MRRILAFVLGSAVTGLLLGGGGAAVASPGACPSSNPPNDLRIASGSPQTAKVRSAFQPLQVELVNKNGCPLTGSLSGVEVKFTAPPSGASGTFASSGSSSATVGTDAQGTATAPTFTANDTPGEYAVHVRSKYGTVDFDLTNTTAGVPASIRATGGGGQATTTNGQYAQPLQAQVVDSSGGPVGGVTVTFAIVPGATGAGASFLTGGGQASVETGANGTATSPPLVANGSPGAFGATASTGGVSGLATYALDNHAAVYSMSAASMAGAATVNSQYPEPLQVQVLDAAGRPVEGVTVGFQIVTGANGAGAVFLAAGAQASATTDQNGQAHSPPLVANQTPGRFTATASINGGATSSSSPSTTTRQRRRSAHACRRTRWRLCSAATRGRCRALVVDGSGRPIEAATVTFQLVQGASGAGASFLGGGTQASALTDASGVAISPPLVASPTPGAFTATAGVAGSSSPAGFRLANLAPRLLASRLLRTAVVDGRYRRSLRVRVVDNHRRPIRGVTVTFQTAADASGAAATFLGGTNQAVVTSDARGYAVSPPLVANQTAGRPIATATTAGRSKPLSFPLENLAGPVSTITAGAASGQTASLGGRFPIRLAVTLTDKHGNPVRGRVVTFAAPPRGPSGHFTIRPPARSHGANAKKQPRAHASRTARVSTDANGIAIAPPFTANDQTGGYAVTARAGAERTAFALVNTRP